MGLRLAQQLEKSNQQHLLLELARRMRYAHHASGMGWQLFRDASIGWDGSDVL